MAGDWIKLRKKLLTDPRVVQIMSRTHRDRFSTVGALFAMWCIADDHGEHMPGVTPAILSEMIGVKGFAEALPEDWLVVDESGVRFPAYDEHNGATAKRRAVEASKKRRQRAGQVSEKRPAQNGTRPGPEKRREELTTTVVDTAKPSADDKPKNQKAPDDSAATSKPKAKTWAAERYDELLLVAADGLTYAKGMPLINKLKGQFDKLTVETAITELCKRGQVVEVGALYGVLTQRCKDIQARPPVAARNAGDGSVSPSLRRADAFDPSHRRQA